MKVDRKLYPIERKQILISQWKGYSVKEIAKFFEGHHVNDDLLLKTKNTEDQKLAFQVCKDLMKLDYYPVHAYPKLVIDNLGIVSYYNIKEYQITIFDQNLILEYDNIEGIKEIATDISLIPYIVNKIPVVIMKENKLNTNYVTQYECNAFEDLPLLYEALNG